MLKHTIAAMLGTSILLLCSACNQVPPVVDNSSTTQRQNATASSSGSSPTASQGASTQDAPTAENASSSASSTDITITVGKTVITATLDDSETSKAFLATLPRTIAMTQYAEREFYGRMEAMSENGTSIPDFENGDVTYYTHGPSLAIFYANSNKSDLDGLIRMGEITSDLTVFGALEESVEMLIEVVG